LLAKYPDTEVIVADDGLQHTALHRDFELCVFDDRGVGNGLLLPAGPLRETLTYPSPPDNLEDVDLRSALYSCGLGRFADKLDEASRWDQTLSASERQRLAFARLLVQKPDIVVLEDALSVFEDHTQDELFGALVAANPAATIIVVGGRASLACHFDRMLSLQPNGEGSVLVETSSTGRVALAIAGT